MGIFGEWCEVSMRGATGSQCMVRLWCAPCQFVVMWVSLESGVKSQCIVQLVLNAWCGCGVLIFNCANCQENVFVKELEQV